MEPASAPGGRVEEKRRGGEKASVGASAPLFVPSLFSDEGPKDPRFLHEPPARRSPTRGTQSWAAAGPARPYLAAPLTRPSAGCPVRIRPTPPDVVPDALKEAVAQALRDNREWFREVLQEALVEAAAAEARREADLRSALAASRRSLPVTHGRA